MLLNSSIKISFSRTRILFIALLVVTSIPSIAASRSRQAAARVSGTVVDPVGAVVIGALVSVESESLSKEVATNREGQYEVDLPPGIYQMKVRSNGFCRERRGSFRARPQTRVRFDFTLIVCPTHSEGPMSYESFTLKSNSSERPDFLIRFGKRIDTESTIQYEGALTETVYYDSATGKTDRRQIYVNTVVTSDNWTISASHLALNKRTFRLEMTGDVSILDGERETKVKRAEVDFASEQPIVNVMH